MTYINPKLIESVKERVLELSYRAENAAAAFVKLSGSINASDALQGYAQQLCGIRETLTDLPFIYDACYRHLTAVVAEYGRAEDDNKSRLGELQCLLDIYLGGTVLDGTKHEAAENAAFAFDAFHLSGAEVPEMESIAADGEQSSVLPSLDAQTHTSPESVLFLNQPDVTDISPQTVDISELELISTQGFISESFFIPFASVNVERGIDVPVTVDGGGPDINASHNAETMYAAAEKFERALLPAIEQQSGAYKDITLSDGLVFVSLPSAALVGAIALLKKADVKEDTAELTARRTGQPRETDGGDLAALRMFQMAAASAYLHGSPLSVKYGSVSVSIPSAEVMPFASALAASYASDLGNVEPAAVPQVGERIEAAEGLRKVVSLIAQSSASLTRVGFDDSSPLYIDVPSAPLMEALSALPVDLTTGTVVDKAVPDWLALASMSSAAVSLVLLLRGLPLVSARHETVTLTTEGKRVDISARGFSSLMTLLPSAQADSDGGGIRQAQINEPTEIYPAISKAVGKIRVDAVPVWPWKEFAMGILLPNFSSAYGDFVSAGRWDGGALPDDGFTGGAQAIPPADILAAQDGEADGGGLVNARAVNDLLRIESMVTDGLPLNIPPVAISDLIGLLPVEVTKSVYSPVTEIKEQNLSAFQPVPNGVMDIASSGKAAGLMDLPSVMFENEDGETVMSATVPPFRGIERFDVEDAGDSLLVAGPVSSVDIAGVTPEVKDLIKPIVSGDIFREDVEVTPVTYSEKLYGAIRNASSVQGGEDIAETQMKAVVGGVAAAIANAAISNIKIEYGSASKVAAAKTGKRDNAKETYGGNSEIYPQGSKAEYQPEHPSADIMADNIKSDVYPGGEYKDGSKQTYISEDIYDESDPNNSLVQTRFIKEGGGEVTVSQPKGVRFWLERLYEMFVSLFSKGGKDEEDAVRTVARAMKNANGNVLFGEDDGRLAVAMTDESDIIDYLGTLKQHYESEDEDKDSTVRN